MAGRRHKSGLRRAGHRNRPEKPRRLTLPGRQCKLPTMEYRFGEFTLDTDLGRLTGPDGEKILRRQSWRLLLELLEQAPALVERDDLLDRVWGRNALSPNALPQTISELRQALGDSARDPQYIETCHGRGYRLVCPVQSHSGHKSARPVVESASRAGEDLRPGSVAWPLVAALGAGVVLSGAITWTLLSKDIAPPKSTVSSQAMVDTLLRKAEVAQSRHDPNEAAAHWRALRLIAPDNHEWALAQIDAELDALQGEQARRSLALLATEPELHHHPWLLVLRSRLAEIDGNFEQAVTLAQAARVQARSLDQPELFARAAQAEARGWSRQGEMESAASVLESAIDEAAIELDQEAGFELALRLAGTRREQGHLAEARSVIERARAWHHGEASHPGLIIEDALITAADGSAEAAWRALSEMDRPENIAPSTSLAYFSALGQIGVEVGEIDQALTAFESAFSIARSSGKAYQVAGLQINVGSLMARHDRFEEAERLWHEALETFERIGDRRGEAIALGNLAAVASAQGHNTRSGSLSRRALDLFRDLELDGPRARTAYNLALVASREGRLDEAEVLFSEAHEGYQRSGALELVLHVGASRVDQRILAGDLILAETLLKELESISTGASNLRQAAILASRGRLETWRGDLRSARRAFEAAKTQRIENGHEGWIATSELELLQLDLLEGNDLWRVRVQALELAEAFRASGQLRAAARARLVAAEALLGQGDQLEARQELEQIRHRQEAFTDTSLALDLSWLEVWAGREEERLARLEALARRALDLGYFGKLAQIEAGLAVRGMSLEALNGIDFRGEPVIGTPFVALLPPYLSAMAGVAVSH